MTVVTKTLNVKTRSDVDIVDITGEVASAVADSGVSDGIVTVFCPGSTGAITTIEYEPGLVEDIPEALEVIAPRGKDYHHHRTWGCDNGRSHVRAAFLGPSLTVPISAGRLTVGTWQQIVFIELDTRGRDRKLVVKIIGE